MIAMEEIDEWVKKIRSDLRLTMNGVISTSMREKGMDYRMNFGVDIPKLREMAARYPASAELAETLWRTETRELKILGTMLFPSADFSKSRAGQWASEIPNQEIREQVCMNLFQGLGFANELVREWCASGDENLRATGFWLFARLVWSDAAALAAVDVRALVDGAVENLADTSSVVRRAALGALKCAGRNKPEIATYILEVLSPFQDSDNPEEREVFDALRFEFQYAGE